MLAAREIWCTENAQVNIISPHMFKEISCDVVVIAGIFTAEGNFE